MADFPLMLYINNTTCEIKYCRFHMICRIFLHIHTCILNITLQLYTVNSWKHLTTFWIHTYSWKSRNFLSFKICTQSFYFSFCKVWSLCNSSSYRLSLTSSLKIYSKINELYIFLVSKHGQWLAIITMYLYTMCAHCLRDGTS